MLFLSEFLSSVFRGCGVILLNVEIRRWGDRDEPAPRRRHTLVTGVEVLFRYGSTFLIYLFRVHMKLDQRRSSALSSSSTLRMYIM